MNIDSLIDFANKAAEEIGKYKVDFILSTQKIIENRYAIPSLDWHSIKYGEEAELSNVPNDKRGVYAFVVQQRSAVLPPHGYVLYIGIAGHDSPRSLRERYKDYLNQKKVMKNVRIARMIGTWYEVLQFFFAPIGDDISSEELKTLECQLNTALMPPFAEKDLEAETKRKRRAFRV